MCIIQVSSYYLFDKMPKRAKRTLDELENAPLKRTRAALAQTAVDITAGVVQRLVPASPACPGKIKPRARGPLSRLPDSDILAAFKQLRHHKRISDEEAVLKFTARYDADLRTLSQVALAKIPFSFNKVTYNQVAPYVWLNPKKRGHDIRNLDVFRARIPRKLLWKIIQDVDESMEQYGRMNGHQSDSNDVSVSRM